MLLARTLWRKSEKPISPRQTNLRNWTRWPIHSWVLTSAACIILSYRARDSKYGLSVEPFSTIRRTFSDTSVLLTVVTGNNFHPIPSESRSQGKTRGWARSWEMTTHFVAYCLAVTFEQALPCLMVPTGLDVPRTRSSPYKFDLTFSISRLEHYRNLLMMYFLGRDLVLYVTHWPNLAFPPFSFRFKYWRSATLRLYTRCRLNPYQ